MDVSLFADYDTIAELAKPLDIKETGQWIGEPTVPLTLELDSTSTASEVEADTMGVIRRTVVEEIGILEREPTESLHLNEQGMGSLLPHTIICKLRDQMGHEGTGKPLCGQHLPQGDRPYP